jgi:hypothetical protein
MIGGADVQPLPSSLGALERLAEHQTTSTGLASLS